MSKTWIFKPEPDAEAVANLSEAINVHKIIASLLVQRGIYSFDDAKNYFRPSFAHLHDPFLMDQMDIAVSRLTSAVQKHEKILVYGDYDVDGTTSVALMFDFLRKVTEHVQFYLPDRYKEGYGVSKEGIDYAQAQGCTLIICLDCGIRANENILHTQTHRLDNLFELHMLA